MISGTANFSPCGRYRYELTRSWDAKLPELLVVMLNPSTADAAEDDPTIRRVVGFATSHGYGELRVVNLYAEIAVDPAALWQRDAVGPLNDEVLRDRLVPRSLNGMPVLAAWGTSEWSRRRAPAVLALVPGVNWHCLGTTKDGSPRHPLYVRASQLMIPFQVPQP